MAKMLRLISLSALALLVASSSVLPAPSVGVIANGYEPRRVMLPRIVDPLTRVIKDRSILETPTIPMTATIGNPRDRYRQPPPPVSRSAPIDEVEYVEQRTFESTIDVPTESVESALEAMLVVQGYDVATQLSTSPDGVTSTVVFATEGSEVVGVFTVAPADGSTSLEATWTD